jgi:hypothetical protein
VSLGGEKGSEKNTCHEGTKTRSEVFLVPWCPIDIGLSGDKAFDFHAAPSFTRFAQKPTQVNSGRAIRFNLFAPTLTPFSKKDFRCYPWLGY